MNNKRKVSVVGILLIVLGVAMIFPGFILSLQVPNEYQYVLPADDLAAIQKGAEDVLESLEDTAHAASISARKQSVLLSDMQDDRSITLYAVDGWYFNLCHETLQHGRLISPGDVENRRNVIVIDHQTALGLYTGGDAIGKTMTIDQTVWTIVGIVRNKARLGETAEGVAFVPITSAIDNHLPMETAEIRLRPAAGTGQDALIRTVIKGWRSDGSFHALAREKYAARMPLLWAAVVAGVLATIWLFRWLIRIGKEQYDLYQTKLRHRYAQALAPWIISRGLLLVLLAGVASATAILTMNLLTAPALIFTDWIPENLVSISSYATRFWAIHRSGSQAIQYISREKSMVTLSSWLIRWGMIAALGGCLTTTNKRRNRK